MSSEDIKSTATSADDAPSSNTRGSKFQSNPLTSTMYGLLLLKKRRVLAEAITEETIIGARALTEKWRSIASQAKTTPAIGAPNPADIAAAAPQATYTSGFNFVGSTDLTSAPTEEPK